MQGNGPASRQATDITLTSFSCVQVVFSNYLGRGRLAKPLEVNRDRLALPSDIVTRIVFPSACLVELQERVGDGSRSLLRQQAALLPHPIAEQRRPRVPSRCGRLALEPSAQLRDGLDAQAQEGVLRLLPQLRERLQVAPRRRLRTVRAGQPVRRGGVREVGLR